MRKLPFFYRDREVARMRQQLERHSFPRLQMSLLVGITGAAGFVASFVLLHAGLLTMWVRYLAAFGVAYLAFLALLWLWLRTKVDDYLDLPDLSGGNWPSGGSADLSSVDAVGIHSGGGGDFAGGGASASFDAPAPAVTDSGSGIGDVVGDAVGSVADADELAIPLLVLALAVALVFSSLYMVYTAPALLAEVAVDGLFAAGLYRKLRGLEPDHWLQTAIKRTLLPFALTAALVSGVGWGLEQAAPGAHTLGQALAQVR
ncbi:hypothetical protein RQP54_14340 [Curvibacter sp. APW13]|uniref:hypothetical protein n=1 Tax=Curvibacter sp. APW13 TaxID=3077236 RepID=UPI0028E01D7C|nr:hypothetical protein [Curvibacter sp. APW13]MDT8992048.1 hypothetical protein [Curvibacter sp. APW13]